MTTHRATSALSPVNVAIGSALRDARWNAGNPNQRSVATAAEVDKDTYIKWETGQRAIRVDKLDLVARFLHTTASAIVVAAEAVWSKEDVAGLDIAPTQQRVGPPETEHPDTP